MRYNEQINAHRPPVSSLSSGRLLLQSLACACCAAKTSDTKVYTMSYQYKRADVCVVVCNICGDFSWVGDNRWRTMPESTSEQPIHLCKTCQCAALWCSAHQQYHLP